MSEKKSILAGTDRNEEPGEREKKSKHGTSETPAEGAGFSRRDFIRGTGLAGVAGSATVLLGDEGAEILTKTPLGPIIR